MTLESFLQTLSSAPETIDFNDTMAIIDALYDFTATAFQNGQQSNEAGQNSGSCKLFAFAKLQNLSQKDTLSCFGQYYRDDVLAHPEGDDHQNIRNFIIHGWDGITFQGEALQTKS